MLPTPYHRAYVLLGSEVVFIPIEKGTKSPPFGHLWKDLQLFDTRSLAYLKTLQLAVAIAAVLGPVSNHIVAIDFDLPEAAELFFSLNPALKASLRTHGRRGCVLWLRIAGDYPARCVKPKGPQGQHLGEWRGGACYSIISGEHMDGGQYTVLVDAPPCLCRFEDIRWPPEWQNIPKLDAHDQNAMQNGIQKNDVGSACSSAWHLGTGGSRATGNSPAQQETLEILFEKFIERHWQPAPQQRNEFLVKAIPFLFSAVCQPAVLWLVTAYYKRNKSLFRDSEKQHLQESISHLKAVAERFRGNLSPSERAKYESLRNERERAAFRICRHLSKHESNRDDCEGDQLVLSYEDLANRLLTNPKSAHRLMKRMARLGVVEMVRNGRRRLPGVRGRATVWRYCLAELTPPPPAASTEPPHQSRPYLFTSNPPKIH